MKWDIVWGGGEGKDGACAPPLTERLLLDVVDAVLTHRIETFRCAVLAVATFIRVGVCVVGHAVSFAWWVVDNSTLHGSQAVCKSPVAGSVKWNIVWDGGGGGRLAPSPYLSRHEYYVRAARCPVSDSTSLTETMAAVELWQVSIEAV